MTHHTVVSDPSEVLLIPNDVFYETPPSCPCNLPCSALLGKDSERHEANLSNTNRSKQVKNVPY